MEDAVGFVMALGVITFIFAMVTHESWWFVIYVLLSAASFGFVVDLAFRH